MKLSSNQNNKRKDEIKDEILVKKVSFSGFSTGVGKQLKISDK